MARRAASIDYHPDLPNFFSIDRLPLGVLTGNDKSPSVYLLAGAKAACETNSAWMTAHPEVIRLVATVLEPRYLLSRSMVVSFPTLG